MDVNKPMCRRSDANESVPECTKLRMKDVNAGHVNSRANKTMPMRDNLNTANNGLDRLKTLIGIRKSMCKRSRTAIGESRWQRLLVDTTTPELVKSGSDVNTSRRAQLNADDRRNDETSTCRKSSTEMEVPGLDVGS